MRFLAPEGTRWVAELGVGSACVVARVEQAGTTLACKRLLPQHRESRQARLSLVREARALELARHPALPALRGVGADEAGPWVLETVIEGLHLREVKARWSHRLPAPLAQHLALQATRVVRELHDLADAAGPVELVHGDLGPDNLLLGPAGEVGVIDLGSARVRGLDEASAPAAGGTAPYLAPELARGEVAPSRATDAYALAATVAWLLLPGETPLADATTDAALLLEIGERGIDARRLGPLPAPLRAALTPLLSLDPAGRSADLEALELVLDRSSALTT